MKKKAARIPRARGARGARKYKPVQARDVADDNPHVITNHLRALQREMRSGFELITQKVLGQLERLNGRVDVAVDRVADLESRQLRTEARLAALEEKGTTS